MPVSYTIILNISDVIQNKDKKTVKNCLIKVNLFWGGHCLELLGGGGKGKTNV